MLQAVVKVAGTVGLTGDSGLGGDRKKILGLLTLLGQIRTNAFFRHTHAIDIGRIDVGNSKISTPIENGIGLVVVGGTIKVAEGHGSITQCRDRSFCLPQSSLLHPASLLLVPRP